MKIVFALLVFIHGAIHLMGFAKAFGYGNMEPVSYTHLDVYKRQYNNSAYFLLGLIVEEVNGTSYEKALQDLVLNPLGMNNSGDRQPDPYKVCLLYTSRCV